MSNSAKISALIPTYNRRTFIFRAIDSILAQSKPVDEIIVVDDGSTDGTVEEISRRYGSLVRCFRQPNMGVSAARRRAIEEATGEWVAFLDSDDEWVAGRNAAFLDAISQVSSQVALIFGNTRFVTDEGEGDSVFRQNDLIIDSNPRVFDNPLQQFVWDVGRARPCVLQSSLIRRSVAIELGCFREGLRHSEDFLAGMQIATRYHFAAIRSDVTRLHRTSDLASSSLEATWTTSEDHRKAIIFAYECAARATKSSLWSNLHSESVRALCKWRAQNGMPIRRLALDQFRCGISVRSIIFLLGAMLGSSFFRTCFAAKRTLRSLGGVYNTTKLRTRRNAS